MGISVSKHGNGFLSDDDRAALRAAIVEIGMTEVSSQTQLSRSSLALMLAECGVRKASVRVVEYWLAARRAAAPAPAKTNPTPKARKTA